MTRSKSSKPPKVYAWESEAIRLDLEGLKLTQIARQLGVHRSSVYRVLKRAKTNRAGSSDSSMSF
jgi:predicted DNA-binding protein (UPF0251 family)